MRHLTKLLGTEQSHDEINLAIKYDVEEQRAPVVGGMLLTCSDESERECIVAFQKSLVESLLPELKSWKRSPFRAANLGGQYEWGALHVAEAHFALSESQDSFKTMIVKINSHVAITVENDRPLFGPMNRYDTDSTACGAIHALMDGGTLPFTWGLREVFGSEGKDRLAVLLDPAQIDPEHRGLFAAIVNARMQTRNAILDIQEHHPTTPTHYIVVACVSLNRPGPDTELLCGFYEADFRGEESSIVYHGLGDDPSRYRLHYNPSHMRVEDDQIRASREVRNHRLLIAEHWRQRMEQAAAAARRGASGLAHEKVPLHQNDDLLLKIIEDARSDKHHENHYTKPMLRVLLTVLIEVSPVPAALLLFADGLGAMYHTHRMHRVARELDRHDDARMLLREIHDKIDELSPERARDIIDTLVAHYSA